MLGMAIVPVLGRLLGPTDPGLASFTQVCSSSGPLWQVQTGRSSPEPADSPVSMAGGHCLLCLFSHALPEPSPVSAGTVMSGGYLLRLPGLHAAQGAEVYASSPQARGPPA